MKDRKKAKKYDKIKPSVKVVVEERADVDLMRLLKRMKKQIPKHDSATYNQTIQSIDWEKIKFDGHSAKVCETAWSSVQENVCKERSLMEVIEAGRKMLENILKRTVNSELSKLEGLWPQNSESNEDDDNLVLQASPGRKITKKHKRLSKRDEKDCSESQTQEDANAKALPKKRKHDGSDNDETPPAKKSKIDSRKEHRNVIKSCESETSVSRDTDTEFSSKKHKRNDENKKPPAQQTNSEAGIEKKKHKKKKKKKKKENSKPEEKVSKDTEMSIKFPKTESSPAKQAKNNTQMEEKNIEKKKKKKEHSLFDIDAEALWKNHNRVYIKSEEPLTVTAKTENKTESGYNQKTCSVEDIHIAIKENEVEGGVELKEINFTDSSINLEFPNPETNNKIIESPNLKDLIEEEYRKKSFLSETDSESDFLSKGTAIIPNENYSDSKKHVKSPTEDDEMIIKQEEHEYDDYKIVKSLESKFIIKREEKCSISESGPDSEPDSNSDSYHDYDSKYDFKSESNLKHVKLSPNLPEEINLPNEE